MGQQEKTKKEEEDTVAMLVCGTLFLLLVGGFVWLVVSIGLSPPCIGPDYTVSITGVDGLNLNPVSPPPTLSPVFNLTVRIENPGENACQRRACVRGLSTAVVSYGDAFLGRGSVPPFCAEKKEVQERAATAWGENVVLPRFLRERLKGEMEQGEAAVDVQVTMPAEACSYCSDKVLVCSKVKIGEGESSPSTIPCRVERVRPMPAAAGSGSTATS